MYRQRQRDDEAVLMITVPRTSTIEALKAEELLPAFRRRRQQRRPGRRRAGRDPISDQKVHTMNDMTLGAINKQAETKQHAREFVRLMKYYMLGRNNLSEAAEILATLARNAVDRLSRIASGEPQPLIVAPTKNKICR